MLNKLIYGNRLILKPYLKALKNTAQDESQLRIQYLQGLVAQNTEQRETLTRLMAQGYIDQVLYSRENNGLVAQCEEFRSEIEMMKKSRTTDAVQMAETEKLLKFVEKPRCWKNGTRIFSSNSWSVLLSILETKSALF